MSKQAKVKKIDMTKDQPQNVISLALGNNIKEKENVINPIKIGFNMASDPIIRSEIDQRHKSYQKYVSCGKISGMTPKFDLLNACKTGSKYPMIGMLDYADNSSIDELQNVIISKDTISEITNNAIATLISIGELYKGPIKKDGKSIYEKVESVSELMPWYSMNRLYVVLGAYKNIVPELKLCDYVTCYRVEPYQKQFDFFDFSRLLIAYKQKKFTRKEILDMWDYEFSELALKVDAGLKTSVKLEESEQDKSSIGITVNAAQNLNEQMNSIFKNISGFVNEMETARLSSRKSIETYINKQINEKKDIDTAAVMKMIDEYAAGSSVVSSAKVLVQSVDKKE